VIYGMGEPGDPHGAKGHCLYTLRRDNVMRPNMWEHPGGKINPGEYVREAAIREAYEELGVVIEVEHTLTTVSFDLVTHAVVLTAVAARIARGEPTPLPLESKALQSARSPRP
jgi:8-oxo-dGTP pyrophosphatase MutT (NUDIX family)